MSAMAEVRPHTWRPRRRCRARTCSRRRPSRSRPAAGPDPRQRRRPTARAASPTSALDRPRAARRRSRGGDAVRLRLGSFPRRSSSSRLRTRPRAPSLLSAQEPSVHAQRSRQVSNELLPRARIALADMVASPEVAQYVARAAGLPASKIGILGPRWVRASAHAAVGDGSEAGQSDHRRERPVPHHRRWRATDRSSMSRPKPRPRRPQPGSRLRYGGRPQRLRRASAGGDRGAEASPLRRQPARARVDCSRQHFAARQRRRLHVRRRLRALVRRHASPSRA